MSSLKFSPNLFLESQELNRFQKFLQDDGFRRLLLLNTVIFGLFDSSSTIGLFDNFLVQQGTNAGTIKHNAGYAFTSAGQLIYKPATDNILLPNDNAYYWLKIAYQASPVELGTVSIDVAGNITGTGTEFLKILRGQPNIPVRISFPNAVSNTGEYDVLSVSSDTAAIVNVVSGTLSAESNLTLQVVGSFSPDYIPSVGEKNPYQYDSCLMTLVAETVLNTPPALSNDLEFFIARVRRNGAALNIEDQRTNYFRDKGNYLLNYVQGNTNALIGIEGIKYSDANQSRGENLVFLAWSFRSTNWTINTNINQLTLNSGVGGKFKSTADFTNGDFDGWRVYVTSSPTTGAGSYKSYFTIRTSSKSGGQINLILDSLQPSFFTDTAQEVIIAPNADQIEIMFSPDPGDSNQLDKRKFLFAINEGETVVSVPVYKTSTCSYNVKYRYKTFGSYRAFTAIPTDAVGYYNEAQWDTNGNLIGSPTRTPYTSSPTAGFITLTLAANSFINRFASITTGDLVGVTTYSLINGTPVYPLQVGVQKQTLLLTGSLTFTVDLYINLLTTGAISGNVFYIDCRGAYTPGAFTLRINQNFINTGAPGINLVTFAAFDYTSSAAANLVFKFFFDGTNWQVEKVISANSASVLSTRTINAGTGLTGGGDLTADRTLALAAGAAATNVGALGGDFTGTLPNPTIANNAVTTAKVLNGNITPAKLSVTVVQSPDNVQLYTKVLQIGDWNMKDSGFAATASVNHGLGANYVKIRSVSIIVRDDTDTFYYQLNGGYSGGNVGGLQYMNNTSIVFERTPTTIWNTTNFDATSFNRGFVTIVYEA